MSEEMKKFILPESAIPVEWINIMADAPSEPLPPLSPATGEPAGPEDLSAIFPMSLIEQDIHFSENIAHRTQAPEFVVGVFEVGERVAHARHFRKTAVGVEGIDNRLGAVGRVGHVGPCHDVAAG